MTLDLARVERERDQFRANLREAWAALAMIREAVETLGPVGAMPSEEAVNAFIAPTFMGEAEAIVAGIQKIANA